MLNKIKSYIGWIIQPLIRLFDKPYTVKFIEDPIDNPKKKNLYVVGTENEPWQVEFLCPCGCADKIVLPVNGSTLPRWRLHILVGIPTLSPSIWRTKGCKSHFFVKQGRIVWC
ncbi:MAG: DUF6527 family protein [Methylophilaceae bacterium]